TGARDLLKQLPDVAAPCVLIVYGPPEKQAHEVLQARDLGEFRAGPDRRLAVIGFVGGQGLTGALARLTAGGKAAPIYVTAGHGELALDDVDPDSRRGIGVLAGQLRELGCEARPLDLSVESRVPHDADLVVIAGGDQAWPEAQVDILGRHLRQGGKAPVLADLKY